MPDTFNAVYIVLTEYFESGLGNLREVRLSRWVTGSSSRQIKQLGKIKIAQGTMSRWHVCGFGTRDNWCKPELAILDGRYEFQLTSELPQNGRRGVKFRACRKTDTYTLQEMYRL
jgi:hypothetical protein